MIITAYDAQGNPTSYLGHTLTWEKGRQLKSFDTNTYTYNANGIRTSKTVSGVKHTYMLDGTKVLKEVWGSNTIVPLYDDEDSVCGIVYNGEPYYFVKNLQGDVIAIVDEDVETVAKYSYDAWGVCTVVSDTSECSIATINPYRYRGYYYDHEIGMYYLQSRYYNPQCGQLLNPDEVSYLGASGTVLGWNLFTYCENDSVNKVDPTGYASICWMFSEEFWRQSERGLNSVKNTYKKWFKHDRLINTYFYELESRRDFIERWNLLPNNLDVLVIDVHATKKLLGIHRDGEIISIRDINSLRYKRIKCLILLGCNAAHSSDRFGNVAYRLFNRISGVLIASDGTVKSKQWYKVTYSTVGDKSWQDQWENGESGTQYGWVIYKHRSRWNYWYSTTLKKSGITAGDLLHYVLKCNLY